MTTPAPGSTAVLLIHGLGGTSYDLGVLQKALRNAGAVALAPTLPGHGTRPEDLLTTHAEAWLDALTQTYNQLLTEHDIVHIAGMCMGSLLALVLAPARQAGAAGDAYVHRWLVNTLVSGIAPRGVPGSGHGRAHARGRG